MTSDQLKASFLQRWKGLVTTIAATGMLVTVGFNWAEERYNQAADIGEIRENVEFLTRLALEDRITRLDGRIQMLETMSDQSRDERQTLNELRLERYQLKQRLDALNGNGGS